MKHIFEFDGKYKPSNREKQMPRENGYYMTIRCGLGGIYFCLDEWKDGTWQVGVLDASSVIAYSREQIQPSEVTEWLNRLREK